MAPFARPNVHPDGLPPGQLGRPAWQRWEMGTLPGTPSDPPVPLRPVGVPAPAPATQPTIDVAELQRLRQQARDAGFAEGRKEGLAKGQAEGHAAGVATGRAETQAQADRLRALAETLPAALRRVEGELSELLLSLALDLARQVVHRSYHAEPEWLLPLVQDLLRREPALQGEPRLLLHPADLALVSGALGPELQSAGWQLRTDESITRGGCVVQAGTGTLDATLETRWARMAEALGTHGGTS